ncbi:unnamed protein product [Hymenolepis diminuta]|uniref:Uncharacterized protein n=1 Tax=Hymenolepis diminuta TaxID=6216 RepID=A0A0R3SC62_HYMDI|nr:unnamed protein product [Hymenolepis diminuta]VUZ53280.1 unnamed protein product [Hymenolepis diminuta]
MPNFVEALVNQWQPSPPTQVWEPNVATSNASTPAAVKPAQPSPTPDATGRVLISLVSNTRHVHQCLNKIRYSASDLLNGILLLLDTASAILTCHSPCSTNSND